MPSDVDADHDALVGFLFEVFDDEASSSGGGFPVDGAVVVFVVVAEGFELGSESFEAAFSDAEEVEVSGLFEEFELLEGFDVGVDACGGFGGKVLGDAGEAEGRVELDKGASEGPFSSGPGDDGVFVGVFASGVDGGAKLLALGVAVFGGFVTGDDSDGLGGIVGEGESDGVGDSDAEDGISLAGSGDGLPLFGDEASGEEGDEEGDVIGKDELFDSGQDGSSEGEGDSEGEEDEGSRSGGDHGRGFGRDDTCLGGFRFGVRRRARVSEAEDVLP